MFKTSRRVIPALVSLVFVTTIGTAQRPAKQKFASVEEAVAAGDQLAGRSGPRSVNWIDNGQRFAYTISNPTTKAEEIRRFDPATLKDELLLDTRDIKLPGSTQPLSYRSFQWARDSEHLLFQTNYRKSYRHSGLADFYMYSVPQKALQLVAKDARTAELSPDGTMAGYERGGDMYIYDIAGQAEKRLTMGVTDSIFNGVFAWVYEEEFGMGQAWRWSPDSRYIAYWQTDEREVPVVQLTNYEGHWPSWTKVPYPKVGDPNPKVHIGVVDVKSGQTIWLESNSPTEEYVPRVYWTSEPNTLAVLTLNRAQNDARIYFYSVTTGQRRLVMEEKAKTFVDIYDAFAGVQDFLSFPEGTREFFWLSDRDGYQHIYRYDYEGKLLNQVTRGPFMVTRIESIDPKAKTIYYSSTEISPLERHLYAVKFDSKSKQRLTQSTGRHLFNMSPSSKYYIDTWSNTQQPRQVELWSTAPKMLKTFETNVAVSQWTAAQAYSPVEIFKFTTSDNVVLDGNMIKPPDFDPSKKYPVILSIYGAPGSQQVYNQFATSGWDQYLAQQGFIVVGLNNRGSGNYSRDFQKMVYGQLGKWESHDFAEVGKWLAAQPYVQGARIGIYGGSYGGYMTVFAMENYPEIFRSGIANSPGTDFSLYDTIYSERYMGLLPENRAGYDGSSVVAQASKLKGYLLLVHSGLDENVHPQHTMQLLTALLNAGKDAEFRFFPSGAHGAAYNQVSRITMLKIYANTWCEHLKASCTPGNINEGKQPVF